LGVCAVLVGGALAGPAAAAEEDGGPRSERAKGAPGYFCKQQGAQPGSDAWRDCIRLAAKARAQAGEEEDEAQDAGEARARSATGAYCLANGASPGSEAFGQCARTARKAARTARA
jgi:hypothetical protein